jgi:GT2 family glycosyltransferase
MNNHAKAAFILISWNNEKLLADCLDSIGAQTYKNHMTILVDNGSADESIKIAKQVMPEIVVIETGVNNGFAKGNNIGIVAALRDPSIGYVALVNTDARLEPDWLETIIDFSRNKPRAACLQGTTLDYYNRQLIDSTHLYVNHHGQAAQGHWREYYYSELGPMKVFGVNAAACVITRRFIEAQPYTQFFDESMFMYLEDVDIAVRATIMGWDNYLVPGARAYHMGSASSGGDAGFSAFGLYMTFRNNLGMLVKNFPLRLLLKIIIKLPLADYRTIRHLRSLGLKAEAGKVVRGRAISFMRIPIYIWQSRKLLGKRAIDKDYLWSLMDKGY